MAQAAAGDEFDHYGLALAGFGEAGRAHGEVAGEQLDEGVLRVDGRHAALEHAEGEAVEAAVGAGCYGEALGVDRVSVGVDGVAERFPHHCVF